MNAARASHPSRIKRVVPCRAPLPYRGCPRGIRCRLALREERLTAAVAGLMPAHRLRPSQFSLAKEPREGVFCRSSLKRRTTEVIHHDSEQSTRRLPRSPSKGPCISNAARRLSKGFRTFPRFVC